MKDLQSLLILGTTIFVGIVLSGMVYADSINKVVMETGFDLGSKVTLEDKNDKDNKDEDGTEFVKLQNLFIEDELKEVQKGNMSINGVGHFGLGLSLGPLVSSKPAFFYVKSPLTSLTGLFESPFTNLFRLIGGKNVVELLVGDGDGDFIIRKLGINNTSSADWITCRGTGEVGIGSGGQLPLAQLHVSTGFSEIAKKDSFWFLMLLTPKLLNLEKNI